MCNRKSGLRDPFQGIEELDFASFTAPYSNFVEDYKHTVYAMKKKKYGRAYLVTYVDDPSLFRITYESSRDRAKGKVTKFYKESLHPDFLKRKWRDKYNKCRAICVPEFDDYAESGRVPIDLFMKVLNVKVACSGCGKYEFSYEDLKNKNCYLVEGEGGAMDFIDGYIICPHCQHELMK